MRVRCPAHGSSVFRRVCRHVRSAYEKGSTVPALGQTQFGLVCENCLSQEVRELLSDESNYDGSSDENIERFMDALETLEYAIGYGTLCMECLHEKTGFDRRTHP